MIMYVLELFLNTLELFICILYFWPIFTIYDTANLISHNYAIKNFIGSLLYYTYTVLSVVTLLFLVLKIVNVWAKSIKIKKINKIFLICASSWLFILCADYSIFFYMLKNKLF